MQVASGHATIESLRKDAGEQTQELYQRLEQVIFSPASCYCHTRVFLLCVRRIVLPFYFFATHRTLLEEVSTESLVN